MLSAEIEERRRGKGKGGKGKEKKKGEEEANLATLKKGAIYPLLFKGLH